MHSGHRREVSETADVKWIKITTNMFDNRKIKFLRKQPQGNNFVLIWVMLLTMAGRCNSGGMIFLTENIPYTSKMLADELEFDEKTIKSALLIFEQLNMIVTDNGIFSVSGWEEHQSIEGLEKIREQNRIRQANFKQRKKQITANVTDNVTVTHSNATEEDKEIDKEIDYIISSSSSDDGRTDFQTIVDSFNSICISLPKVTKLTDKRKKLISARLADLGNDISELIKIFEAVERSDFLSGRSGDWTGCCFDWLFNESNFVKVQEGNYFSRTRTTAERYAPTYDKSEIEQVLDDEMAELAEEDDNPVWKQRGFSNESEYIKYLKA